MAINRFQNPDILVDSKVPVQNVQTYELEDFSNQSVEPYALQINEISNQFSGPKTEAHIYSADVLIHSSRVASQYDEDISDSNTDLGRLYRR